MLNLSKECVILYIFFVILIETRLSRHNIERGLSLIFSCTMYINISDGKKIDKNNVNPITINIILHKILWPHKNYNVHQFLTIEFHNIFFYLDVNKLNIFSSKPFYIICLINFMKKIHLHKSYIKYLRRYVVFWCFLPIWRCNAMETSFGFFQYWLLHHNPYNLIKIKSYLSITWSPLHSGWSKATTLWVICKWSLKMSRIVIVVHTFFDTFIVP